MTTADALRIAQKMKEKLSCKMEGAMTDMTRRYYEEQDKMLTYAISAMMERQERENPKPLTEDELRQMMGEPVWCVYEGGAHWFLVGPSIFTILNGFTAYRYKPADHYREVTKMIGTQTNADRIRAMTDEELAAMLYDDAAVDDKLHFCQNRQECMDAIALDDFISDEKCMGCLLEWLRKPVEEVKNNA